MLMFKQQCSIVKYCKIRAPMGRISDSRHMFSVVKYIDWVCSSSQRPLPQAGLSLWAEEEHSVLHPGDLCPLEPAGGPLMGFLLDFPVLRASTYLYRYRAKQSFFTQFWKCAFLSKCRVCSHCTKRYLFIVCHWGSCVLLLWDKESNLFLFFITH